MNNMTALMSAFVRWYHHEKGFPVIFLDDMAGEILTEKEKITGLVHQFLQGADSAKTD